MAWVTPQEAPLRLKPTFAVLSAVAVGSALFVTGGASAAQPLSATGGGQILIGTQGAGNTIAFTARNVEGETPDAARGQVQYVNREAGNGRDQVVLHGDVDCMVIDPAMNTAHISGTYRDEEETPFALYVQDNGEGAGAQDMIAIAPIDAVSCSDETAEDEAMELGRGNAQVRDGESDDS